MDEKSARSCDYGPPVHPYESKCGQIFLSFSPGKGQKVCQESREDLKVQGACSALRGRWIFSTLHMDGYRVKKQHLLQDTVVKPHRHILVQMCRKAITDRSRCIALHHIVPQHIRNVANRDL